MTDAQKMPAFPKKPKWNPNDLFALEQYYRDLAAAWEAVAREAVAELENISKANAKAWQMPLEEYRDAFRPWAQNRCLHTLARIGPLPPKEG